MHCLFVNAQIIHYLCVQARCKHKEHAIVQCDKYRAHLHVSKELSWKKHRRQKRQPQTDYDYDAAMSNRLWSMLYLGFTSFLHHKISTRIWCLCHFAIGIGIGIGIGMRKHQQYTICKYRIFVQTSVKFNLNTKSNAFYVLFYNVFPQSIMINYETPIYLFIAAIYRNAYMQSK